MKYVLDTNVFITAKNTYYAFDLVPRFWDELVRLAALGTLKSVDAVREEILRGKDDLAMWAKQNATALFDSTDSEPVVECYQKVMTWVTNHPQFTPAAKASFASGADGWVVAYAMTHHATVVTLETRVDPLAKSRVKIPNVANQFGLGCIET
jgi:hypothetical protein